MTERLGELSGQRIGLRLDDTPLTLTFEITARGVKSASIEAHVTMSGALADLVALARRREESGTLSFQRRLVVEGETETGLHLKYLLDGWDYDLGTTCTRRWRNSR